MKIEINVNVTGFEPLIKSLVASLMGTAAGSNIIPITGNGKGESLPPADNTEKEAPAGTEELTPAQKQKAELSAQIIALGGTPPDKGAVSKFEECLAELQKEKETPAEEKPKEEPEAKPKDKGASLEEVRMLAGFVVRNEADGDKEAGTEAGKEAGKARVAKALKEVGAANITALFEESPEQVTDFITLLEKEAGKTLSEVVAETTAD